MTIVCDPTATNPTHHIKLSDGSTELGFILRSGTRTDPRAINRRPRQNGQYSPFTQSDWGGGRGIKDSNADRSRYADGKRAITRHNGTVMIGPQEAFTTGYRQAEAYMPGSLTWQSLLDSNRYIITRTTASGTGNRLKVYIPVRRRGTPTSTLTFKLMSESGGVPDADLKTVTKTTTDITDTVSQLVEFEFSSVQAVTNTTNYWLKIYTSTADTATDYWQVGTDAARGQALTQASTLGVTFLNASYDLYYRLVDDTELLGGLFFYFKSQVYFVTRPSGAATPKLYVNGDRGVATGGSQSVTVLQDTTKSWTTNEWFGATVLIISGTNSEWQVCYRTIASNTSTALTTSLAFPKAHVAGSTTYVILASNKWTEITGHGLTVIPTSVVSSGDVCYFAQGDLTKMRRMREYVNNAAYTREFAEEDNYAKFLVTFRHPTRGTMIGKANDFDNSGNPSFAQASAEAWGRRLKFPMLINDCEATTGWTAGANATVTVDNTIFMTKNKSIKITVSSGPANPVAYYAATLDLRGQKAIRFWIRSDVNRAAGDVKVFPSISASAASTIQDLNVPALTGTEWQQVTLPFTDTLAGTGGVASIGFRVTAATGTYWIDGLETVPNGSEVPLGNPGEKITGINRYGDPEVPWIFRTQSAGSIEGGVFNPIPLRELSTAENVYNGSGNVVHNVYLYFSFLHGLERFYRNNLDDVGPNRDEGLPNTRRGYITSMQGYIGRFFYNQDVAGGYSSIFESTSGTDHHELYRCDTLSKRIRNLFIQVVPGGTADRLWFTEGSDIAWLTLPGNTLKEDTDSTFKNTHEGVLETGWITGGESDAIKLFSSVKLFTEATTSNRKIEWDYKKDADTSWTPISTAFSTPPVQEITLNISARRLKLRFRLQTNDNTVTPQIRGMVIEATTRPEIRYTYSMRTIFADDPINLIGEQDTTLTAEAVMTQLDTWVANNTVLTMSSLFTPFHNKSVFLEPVVTNPLTLIPDASKERLEGTLVLVES